MNPYQGSFHAKGDVEVRGLPERPSKALYDTLIRICRDPWGETEEDPAEGDRTFRLALFDDGDGIVHVRVDDYARTVTVHGVTWVG